jgi:hypothetical protein
VQADTVSHPSLERNTWVGLRRAGIKPDESDLLEVNKAFAAPDTGRDQGTGPGAAVIVSVSSTFGSAGFG